MIGHSNPEALRHLLKAATGVEFTTKELDSIICQRYKLINAKEQVSKAPRERSTLLFDSVSQDVIYIKDGLEGEKRVLYIIDDYTRVYFVFTLLNDKLDSMIKCLKAITAYVFRQYGLIIRVQRHDSLPTLIQSTRYEDWIIEEGYVIEVSSPYT